MPDDVEPHEVWPDNVEALNLFIQVSTQWLMGPVGPYGLNYPAMYPLMDRMHLSNERWLELFEEIRTMEQPAVEEIRRNAR